MTSVIGSGSTEHCELCKEIVKYEKYTRTKLAIETASEEVQMVDLAEKKYFREAVIDMFKEHEENVVK